MESSPQEDSEAEPAGWYHAEGDPTETVRYWNGSEWVGGPVAAPSDTQSLTYPIGASLASPGERVGAWVIDWIILGIILSVIFAVAAGDALTDWATQVQAAVEANQDPPPPDFEVAAGSLVLMSALPFVWSTIWVAALGATPGKLMVGARVANGKALVWQRATLIQAVLRSANRLLFLVGFVSIALYDLSNFAALGILVASLIMLFTDTFHRSVMDRVANTLVVKSAVMGDDRPGAGSSTI